MITNFISVGNFLVRCLLWLLIPSLMNLFHYGFQLSCYFPHTYHFSYSLHCSFISAYTLIEDFIPFPTSICMSITDYISETTSIFPTHPSKGTKSISHFLPLFPPPPLSLSLFVFLGFGFLWLRFNKFLWPRFNRFLLRPASTGFFGFVLSGVLKIASLHIYEGP